jgi:hypothetical protein
MTTPLWADTPSILYEKKYIFEILPHKDFDFNRKLNCILRLSIMYSFIIVAFDRSKVSHLYIPFVVALITYIMSRKYKQTKLDKVEKDLMDESYSEEQIYKDEETQEEFVREKNIELVSELSSSCRTPTKENPFMNPKISDYNTSNDINDVCLSYNNKGVQQNIDNHFNDDLYQDVNDIFGKNNSQRQFFTVPGRTIPNDQGGFARWLYGTPPTCKEGNGVQCAANQYGVSRGPGSDDNKL